MVETANFGNITWLHIINPSDENLEYLKEKFNFHIFYFTFLKLFIICYNTVFLNAPRGVIVVIF